MGSGSAILRHKWFQTSGACCVHHSDRSSTLAFSDKLWWTQQNSNCGLATLGQLRNGHLATTQRTVPLCFRLLFVFIGFPRPYIIFPPIVRMKLRFSFIVSNILIQKMIKDIFCFRCQPLYLIFYLCFIPAIVL